MVGAFWRPPRSLVAAALAFASGALIPALAFDLFEESPETGGDELISGGPGNDESSRTLGRDARSAAGQRHPRRRPPFDDSSDEIFGGAGGVGGAGDDVMDAFDAPAVSDVVHCSPGDEGILSNRHRSGGSLPRHGDR